MGIEVVVTLAESSLFIPIFFAVNKKKYWYGNPTLEWLSVFIAVTFIQLAFVLPHDLLGYMGIDTPNTVFYYNWHYILAGYSKLMIYYTLLSGSYKKLLIASFALIITIFTLLEFSTDSLTYYNTALLVTKVYLIVNLLVIILSLMYAYQLLQDLSIENIAHYSFFWLNSGFLLYHIGSISVYSFVGNGATKEEGEIAWIINAILLFLLYGTISLSYHYSKKLRQKT